MARVRSISTQVTCSKDEALFWSCTCPQKPHLRKVNSGFSDCVRLKLTLVIQLLIKGNNAKISCLTLSVRQDISYLDYIEPIARSTIPINISIKSMTFERTLRSPKSNTPHIKVTITDERRIIDTTAIIASGSSRAW